MIFTQERLDQGAQLAVAQMPHVESVSVGFWLGVGGRHESKRQNGIFHFLEHMLFKGTTKRTAREISEAVEGVGGYLNAFTAEEMTCYYARASATHLRAVVDVLSDMLLRATFPAAEIERERGVIQEEIRMYEDQPSQLAQDVVNMLLWPNNPLGRPLLGSSENVQRMRRRDLLNYRRKFYHSGNLFITVAGKTDLAEVKELLRPLLRQFPTGSPATCTPVSRRQTAPRFEVIRKPIEQTQFVIGLRGVSRHDPRRSAFRLMSVMLGENMSSRLFQNVREKHGLAYSIGTNASYYHEAGSFFVNAGVENSKTVQAIRLTLQTIAQLARRAPSLRELRRAKEYTFGQIHLSLESTDNQMMWLGESLVGHQRVINPDKLIRQIEAVTPEEVRAAAALLVHDEKLNVAVVSPTAELAEIEAEARF
ncbi:MAG: insulinase family protein [Methylacidiphilales bacterium]|nr:insulinase family protein [Candidatus Methylacidiphilales bacterium]